MKFTSIIASCLLIAACVGCTSLASDKGLKHEVVTLDSAIKDAEQAKAGILNHAVIEGTQDSDNVKAAVAGIDSYIVRLKQQKKETEAVLGTRTPATP